ncbi:alpha/beta-hydrolase [Punctularia strigosozonata HHB-11173 SS5]|uniref:alpha/beta-hydrolase n=1 Tax=Punctularia strigosozonata (strain HHB-11173) TaxID=741275 RepID=UPI0004417E40|nr:alpha/beta-hydrolase [Punctularia strigosozonata HHB-11173 SS5]EIN11755.1 alpha/beta-hydrolase [Punctularia strigosozonata HHB-11173 SS5]
MDPSLYRNFKTARGINYHYYFSAPSDAGSKPTLLFLHGFPSTSYDWRHQVAFFGAKEGFGLVVPDMLGYAGTDKPTDGAAYSAVAIAKDMVEILEHERVGECIAIGHDWGTAPLSRLAMQFSERFMGFAWLAVHHIKPARLDYEDMIAKLRQAFGYDVFGYWQFFDSPDAAGIIEKHIDSFLELLYPEDPALWKTHVANTGKLREWVESDSHTQRASYLTDEDYQHMRSTLLSGGMKAPLLWYTNHVRNLSRDADLAIPLDKWKIAKPVFFGAALKDYVCLAPVGKAGMRQAATREELVTVIDFDTSHWIQLEAPEELNARLLEWIDGVVKRDERV